MILNILPTDRKLALQEYFHKNFYRRKQNGKFRCAVNTLNMTQE